MRGLAVSPESEFFYRRRRHDHKRRQSETASKRESNAQNGGVRLTFCFFFGSRRLGRTEENPPKREAVIQRLWGRVQHLRGAAESQWELQDCLCVIIGGKVFLSARLLSLSCASCLEKKLFLVAQPYPRSSDEPVFQPRRAPTKITGFFVYLQNTTFAFGWTLKRFGPYYVVRSWVDVLMKGK